MIFSMRAGNGMRFTLQVADQPTRFAECDRLCRSRDQRRDRSLLSRCGFIHGSCQLVRAGVRAHLSLSLSGATNATPPRVGLFASVPAGARPSLGRAAQRPCGPAIARNLEALRRLAVSALAVFAAAIKFRL